jgi:hypothetical protein
MIHVIYNPISPDFPAKMPMLWENAGSVGTDGLAHFPMRRVIAVARAVM